jgi:uncharacterized protein
MRSLVRFLLILSSVAVFAQTQPPPFPFHRTEVMIPMRDGVKLQTAIFTPPNHSGPLPIILTRGPYGVPDACCPIDHHEIVVYQNLRGRFKSEGTFVMQRPPRDRNDPKSIDEATDAYDTIDWLVKNVPNNNARVGMFGTSYGGWTVTMALLEPHPAMKAVIEAATPADMFLGDDFHHNGAFRLSYGFEYAALLETAKDADTHFEFDRYDTYEWYLALGALSNANARYFHGKLPTWNDFVAHPNRDAFWQKQAFATFLHSTTVPVLNVAGWWDQEDFYGPQKVYELLEQNDTKHLNYFVAGPWNHGEWNRPHCTSLGAYDYGVDTCQYYHAQIEQPWWDHWLHGDADLKQPEALTFETGANQWKSYDAWPPSNVSRRDLYFAADGRLTFDRPSSSEAFDEYVSDPANPVPYRHRPISPTYPGPGWPTWLVQDQRFASDRPDTLTWETDPLADDVVIAGDLVTQLYASTTGTDSDWVVKLIDVYPEKYEPKPEMGGYQLMIADEVFRGRFRNSFERPEAIEPGKVTRYTIDLHTGSHAFQKGHRIMVQVQSTWFPIIDRNPQTFVPNIFEAKDSDYRKATQRVYRTTSAPSHIELPVIGK